MSLSIFLLFSIFRYLCLNLPPPSLSLSLLSLSLSPSLDFSHSAFLFSSLSLTLTLFIRSLALYFCLPGSASLSVSLSFTFLSCLPSLFFTLSLYLFIHTPCMIVSSPHLILSILGLKSLLLYSRSLSLIPSISCWLCLSLPSPFYNKMYSLYFQ